MRPSSELSRTYTSPVRYKLMNLFSTILIFIVSPQIMLSTLIYYWEKMLKTCWIGNPSLIRTSWLMTHWISDQIFCCCIKQFQFISKVLTNDGTISLNVDQSGTCIIRCSRIQSHSHHPFYSVKESRLRPLNRSDIRFHNWSINTERNKRPLSSYNW